MSKKKKITTSTGVEVRHKPLRSPDLGITEEY